MTFETRLAGIKARWHATTAGIWKTFIRPKLVSVMMADREIVRWMGFDGLDMPWKQRGANAQFIAHAHQDVPYLLAEVERLQVLGDTMADRLSMIGEAYDHDGTNLVRQWRQGR